jgi:hypothetical protein
MEGIQTRIACWGEPSFLYALFLANGGWGFPSHAWTLQWPCSS